MNTQLYSNSRVVNCPECGSKYLERTGHTCQFMHVMPIGNASAVAWDGPEADAHSVAFPPRLKLTLTLTAILRAWDRGQISEKVLTIWLDRHYSY